MDTFRSLLPRPREIEPAEASAPARFFPKEVRLAPGGSERLKRAVERWADGVGRLAGLRPETRPAADRGGEVLHLRLGTSGGVPAQGYALDVAGAEAVLEAPDEPGLFHGLQTIRQLLEECGGRLPELRVRDWPDLSRRGYMLDVSRCKVPRMSTLYALADRLSSWKINELQLYVEHVFAFQGHERVWRRSSPLTGEEIRDLDAYCRDRYIELVPNLNSFGHLDRWLRHPEYRHLAESPDGFVDPWGKKRPFGATLKPDETSLAFLDSLYREYLPHFSSDRFNVGCDETFELGRGRSRAKAAEKGVGGVYLEFLLGIHGLVEKHGRSMQFWGDIILKHPETVPELPRSVTAMIWGYETDHPYEAQCAAFRDAGVPFYVVPGTNAWKSLLGRSDVSRAAIRKAAQNGLRFGAEGMLITDWGDDGHHQFFPVSLPGLVYGAATAWAFEANRELPLPEVLDRRVFEASGAGMGETLIEAGTAYRLTGKLPDQSTLFHHLLFAPGDGMPRVLESVSSGALRAAANKLDELSKRLAGVSPKCRDIQLMARELELNLRMARHALRRGLAILEPASVEPKALRADLDCIMEEFRTVWLERARPGGLEESISWLENPRRQYWEGL